MKVYTVHEVLEATKKKLLDTEAERDALVSEVERLRRLGIAAAEGMKAYDLSAIKQLLSNQIPEGHVTVPIDIWEVLCERERERDALAAKLDKIDNAWFAAGSWPDTFEEKQRISDAIVSDPQQCLRDIQADAVLCAIQFFKPALDIDTDALEAYAATVRQGGE